MSLDLDAIERDVDSTFSEWDQLGPRTKDVVYKLIDRARLLNRLVAALPSESAAELLWEALGWNIDDDYDLECLNETRKRRDDAAELLEALNAELGAGLPVPPEWSEGECEGCGGPLCQPEESEA